MYFKGNLKCSFGSGIILEMCFVFKIRAIKGWLSAESAGLMLHTAVHLL